MSRMRTVSPSMDRAPVSTSHHCSPDSLLCLVTLSVRTGDRADSRVRVPLMTHVSGGTEGEWRERCLCSDVFLVARVMFGIWAPGRGLSCIPFPVCKES